MISKWLPFALSLSKGVLLFLKEAQWPCDKDYLPGHFRGPVLQKQEGAGDSRVIFHEVDSQGLRAARGLVNGGFRLEESSLIPFPRNLAL